MAVGSASSVKNRARSIAHRWGPSAVVDPAGPELLALAIRYDEEDLPTSETFVLRLGPGRADAIDGMLGTAAAIAAADGGQAFVLDARGVVHAGARRHKLQGARALTAADGGVVVAGDLRLWRIDAAGERVDELATLKARLLASSGKGVLCATEDQKLSYLDSAGLRTVTTKLDAPGVLSAIHVDDSGHVLAVVGKTVLGGDLDGVAPVATSTFDIDAVATFAGRSFVSSKIHGLCVVEDGKVMKLRPSIRAHTLATRGGLMVASASLCMATTDDGIDFLTRDLAPFVRIADQRMPRFLQSDDSQV